MRECFVIMPIGSDDAKQVYRNRYEHIIRPAVEGLRIDGQQVFCCVRADFVTKTGSITRDLLGRLYRADAVIADLTDLNPNVFYELGVRHALRAGTILIALKGTKPPFDVGDLRIIPYEDRLGGEKEAIPQIQEMLNSLLAEERPQDSPVLHVIPELAELGAVKEHKAQIASLLNERDMLKAQLEVSEKTSLSNQAAIEGLRAAIEQLGKRLPEPQRRDAQVEIESIVKAKRAAAASIRVPRLGNVSVDPETAFILMPFSQDLEPIYNVILKAGAAAGIRAFRADAITTPGSIINQIYESIAKSGLIVADLTGRNQNVMYELGLANAMDKRTILLSQDIQDVPFDVRGERILLYNLRSPAVTEKLQHRLVDAFLHYRKETEDENNIIKAIEQYALLRAEQSGWSRPAMYFSEADIIKDVFRRDGVQPNVPDTYAYKGLDILRTMGKVNCVNWRGETVWMATDDSSTSPRRSSVIFEGAVPPTFGRLMEDIGDTTEPVRYSPPAPALIPLAETVLAMLSQKRPRPCENSIPYRQ